MRPFSALDPLDPQEAAGRAAHSAGARQEDDLSVVSHDLDEALKLGDKVTILEGGRIVQSGTGPGHRERAGRRLRRGVRAPREPAHRHQGRALAGC